MAEQKTKKQVGKQPINLSQKRLRIGFSIGLICFSLFTLLALISFLFNWKWDQSTVHPDGLLHLTNEQVLAKNLMGKIGASWAYLIMFSSVGIASFLLPPLFFVLAIRILSRKWIINPARFLQHILFLCFALPFTISLLTPHQWTPLEGKMGTFLHHYSFQFFGTWGSWLILLGGWAIYISFHLLFFKLLYQKISDLWQFRKSLKTETTQANWMDFDSEEDSETVITENPPKEDPPSADSEKSGIEFQVHYDTEDTELPTPEGTTLDQVDNGTPPSTTNDAPDLQTPSEVEANVKGEAEPKIELQIEDPQEEKHFSDKKANKAFREFGPYDPKLDLANFKNPGLDLLDVHERNERPSISELEEKQQRIVDTLASYSIEIQEIKANVGPTVTLYEIVPKRGVRLSKIKNLEDDIALSLAALGIRIIAPIPGKGTVGIEVPNSKPDVVAAKNLLSSQKFIQNSMELPIALGKTISNETFVVDLAKMPHLLMAGATGQGKSVGLNMILVSLLYQKHPSQLKFVLVDPKKVELSLFNKIERHYLAKLPDTDEAIITDTAKVVTTLNSLCIEMDARYDLLKTAFVRNIKEYNDKFVARKLNPENGHQFLPYIVLVVDEFADLIMTAGKEVEMPIARLAQLARAVGIHLIIATQRPSVNIITGTIKANFPARIAFRVTSKIDSRTILDAGGAEQLIGRGDMLYSTGSDLVRLQCGFVDTHEVDGITDFIGNQRGYPECFMLPEYIDESADNSMGGSIDEKDSLYEEAARIVVMSQQGSTSLIQRKLKIGYNRAGRIVDQLEATGILGPFKGSKAREVLIPDDHSLEQFLNDQ